MNTFLKEGHSFFSDLRKEGTIIYEIDDEPLAEPGVLTPEDRLRVSKEHFSDRSTTAVVFLDTARYALNRGRPKEAAFLLHQSLEQSYSPVLLTPTSYAQPSHTIKFLRSLTEEQDQRLAEGFPRDQRRERA
ncbi:MAG: hypothetical protein KJ947_02975 [Alphaproteobacteria bacterium]|nr:hypothetical protein [Alphaproteobacteria bacterium]MBU1548525.1 hypothetical protein [Alphaproteobacteria bacterium]MBU2337721.1 hypothetical protein [Alphaproteobacteria bacterium]MBU2389858.1 hypothetical protein [Alphaproteobacteria bacterium]